MLNALYKTLLSPREVDGVDKEAFHFDPHSPRLRLIAGDASDRKFYRCRIGEHSFICMVFPSWRGGYGGDPMSWLGMYAALRQWQLPIPGMVHVDEQSACIWTDDLGDSFLNDNLGTVPLDMLRQEHGMTLELYREALRLLVRLQYPLEDPGFEHPALERPFDTSKLLYELNFFAEHFLVGLLGQAPDARLQDEWQELAETIAGLERILCHRDYHARNIMVFEGRPIWIDFQDARMGPHAYDVVSLLRDSYVRFEKHTRDSLFTEYLEALNNARRRVKKPVFSPAEFYRERLLVGLQRNLKAIGSFGFLACKKGKRSYLSYVPHTLSVIAAESAASELPLRYPATFELLGDLQSGPLGKRFQEICGEMNLVMF